MARINRTQSQCRDVQIIAGVGKQMQNVPSITLLGTTYATSDLTKAFQAQISALASLAGLRARVKDAIVAARAQEKELRTLAAALKSYLLNAVGNSATVLGDFGFTPKKVAQKDPVTHVVAAARMRATRKERGTKGSVQRKVIKGTVPATIEVSTVTGAMSSPSATTAMTAQPTAQAAAARPKGTP